MGKLVEGIWREAGFETNPEGAFVRAAAAFRDRVTRDGSSEFPAQAGRYHLYVSLACPWASRTLIFRKLKKLEQVISLSVVAPVMGKDGWRFSDEPGCIPDSVLGASYLYQIYATAQPSYTGRVTVPVLFDKQTRRIVNNESSEIIRMLNSDFDEFADPRVDFYPRSLRGEIDAINRFVQAALLHEPREHQPDPNRGQGTRARLLSTARPRALHMNSRIASQKRATATIM